MPEVLPGVVPFPGSVALLLCSDCIDIICLGFCILSYSRTAERRALTCELGIAQQEKEGTP